MADLLLFWLNHELQLSTVVTNMETDFASGYLLGEVLHRLNQQHNLEDFVKSASADAKIINFCLLEPTLRNMNIKFDANTASAIMNEARGAAANVLYQIKMAAKRIQRAPVVSTKSFEQTGVIPLHNRPVKLPKPIFDASNHRAFEHSIRRQVHSSGALQRQKDEIVEEAEIRKAYRISQQEEKDLLERTKAERLHKAFLHSQFIKEALNETDSPAWRQALETKNAREQRRAAFYRQLMAKHTKAEEDRLFSLRRTVRDDLGAFDRQEAVKAGGGSKPSLSKSAGYGLRSLAVTLAKSSDSTDAAAPTSRYEDASADNARAQDSKVIKQQKLQRDRRKEAHERRRKRFLQNCSLRHTNLSGVRVTAILETLTLRSTNTEREVCEEIERVVLYKDIARENRTLRCLAYNRQRESDVAARIESDSSFYQLLLRRYEDDVNIQDEERQRLEWAVDGAEHHNAESIAKCMMNEVLDFVVFAASKREDSQASRDSSEFLNGETWTEYCELFAAGNSLNLDIPATDDDRSLQLTEQHQLLDARAFGRYLSEFQPSRLPGDYVGATAKTTSVSPWLPSDSKFVGATDVLEECFVLGEEIKYLRWINHTILPSDVVDNEDTMQTVSDSLPTTVVQSPLGDFANELRIVFFGPPFAGKETQATLLAQKFNLALLCAHRLLDEAVANKTELGVQIEKVLAGGDKLPFQLYAQLAVEAIQGINRGTDDQATSDGCTSSTNKKSGWILYGLPSTEGQAIELEKLLSGYVDPRAIPSPYDFESPVVPGCPKPELPATFFHDKSGIDLVFYLQCDAASATERCLGQVEDGETGAKWHLQHNPPPEDSTTRHRLQHSNHSQNASELLSIHLLTHSKYADDQRSWHSKFDTLREVDTVTTQTPEGAHEAIVEYVEEFVRIQQQKNLSCQQDQESSELNNMIEEEARHERIRSLDAAIVNGQEELVSRQQALQQGEEAKAKKEELVELRNAVDAAKQHVEKVILNANTWVAEERATHAEALKVFSGDLQPELARLLVQTWNETEEQYISAMHRCFRHMRHQRSALSEHTQSVVNEFCAFVRRPDRKQSAINTFQQQFNEVIDDMRFDDSTKEELHARTDIFQDDMTSLLSNKRAENDAELVSLLSDGWTEDACQSIAATYQLALQAECDRFRVSLQLLVDGYSASSRNRSDLSSFVENFRTQLSRVDFSCRIFRDPSGQLEESPPPVAAAPPVSTKPPPKGKGKAAAAAHAAPAAPAPDPTNDGNGDPMSIEDMQGMFDTAVHKCETFIGAVLTTPAGSDSQDVNTTDLGQNICALNLRNGIKFEHELMQRRVRFLREVSLAASDQLKRAMRMVENTLRQVIDDRKRREDAAVASLIQYIRAAIESETGLPCWFNVAPQEVYRFPITAHLLEDTLVAVDESKRLVPLAPPEEPPVVEDTNELQLSTQQREHLKATIGIGQRSLVPVFELLEAIEAASSLPDAMPTIWRECSSVVFAQIASKFMRRRPGFVDLDAFLDWMCQNEGELRRIVDEDQRPVDVPAATTATRTEESPEQAGVIADKPLEAASS